MAAHKAQVKPLRLRGYSAELAVDFVRGVGHRAVCSCGWRGKLRRSYQRARADLREHVHR